MEAKKDNTKKVIIAAMGDIHMDDSRRGKFRDLLQRISQEADVLCLCGDLTDHGLIREAEMLAEELQACTIPIVGVLGNHDYDKDEQEKICAILSTKMAVLDGTIVEFAGVQFAGVKGFGGGFRPSMWGRIGEHAQKVFYDEQEHEAEKLENALNEMNRLPNEKKVVLMHFSPIRDTLEGELVELYAFLGSSRLEEVIDRYPVSAVFHGHVHYGVPKGKTDKDIPVYNVSYFVMQRHSEKRPFALVEI